MKVHKIAGMRAVALGLMGSASALVLAGTAHAQDAAATAEGAKAQATNENNRNDSLFADIVVTATKQSIAQTNQKVPITVSAFNSEQINALKLTNIQSMAYAMPNVSFETPGAMKGTANFTIRGLGLNSSIASSAPTVGVFQNGIYLGINQGVLVDTFDLDSVEVLRGPQGTLFGRNVTGGAVLLNSRKPRSEPDLNVRARLETGPEYSLAVAGGGGVTDTVSARLAVLYRKDEGYFNNVTLKDKHFGKDEVLLIRPSLRYENGGTDITIFGEYGQNTGDGPVSYSPEYRGGTLSTPGIQPERGFKYRKVYENFRGTTDTKWYSVSVDAKQDVGFGEDGQIALLAGYRNFDGYSEYASDGTELTVSHNASDTRQHQTSFELRYNGKFGPVTVTVGGFYFNQKLEQLNKQFVIDSTQGGIVKEDVYAVFGQADIAFTDELTLQLGGRYTYEKKHGLIAALAHEDGTPRAGTFGVPGSCILTNRTCDYQYSLDHSWKNFSPKISLQYQLPNVLFYASAQKAFRSGGYNVRYNGASAPNPYDGENQKAAEIGFKTDLFDKKTRFNGAAFYTKIKGLQRDITIFDNITLANVTRTLNTADATVKGFEVELVQQIVPGVIFNANAGYVDAKYDKIRFDITQDGVVNDFDLKQRLPRVSPWTVAAGITAKHDFDFGKLTFRGNYSHRDASYFTDYNFHRADTAVPKLPAADIFDAQITWEPQNSNFSLTVYGRNLTNAFTLSAFTPIVYPNLRGCACNPNKGRVLGVEATYGF